MKQPNYPFHFREDGVLVDAHGEPVPPLPKVPTKGPDVIDEQPRMRRKFNPRMITEDFDGRHEDE